MINLLNIKLTDNRTVPYKFYRRYEGDHYAYTNRFDIFKYFLSSRAVLEPLVTKYIFFIEVSHEFHSRKNELEKYIESIFPKNKLLLFWHRNNNMSDWRNFYKNYLENFDDNIIWFDGNDDHIFIDSSLDLVENGINILKSEKDQMAFIYHSHWPESIRLANNKNAEYVDGGNFVKHIWNNFDASMILKKERFKRYWFDYDFGDKVLYKTDELLYLVEPIQSTAYIPTKEIVRHFDGYGHVGDINLTNMFPSMAIPIGFFEKNINILYGYFNRNNSMVNINPCIETLYAIDSNGTDYRWALEDIPLFWKDKISSIIIDENCDMQQLNNCRNIWLLKSPTLKLSAYGVNMYADYDNKDFWFKKHIL